MGKVWAMRVIGLTVDGTMERNGSASSRAMDLVLLAVVGRIATLYASPGGSAGLARSEQIRGLRS